MWEVYVIEGLTGGRVALVNKTHHAMVDRIGAVDVAAAILDVNRRPRDLPDQPWIPSPEPSEIDLVVDAVADLTTRPSEMLDVVRFAASDVREAVTKVAGTVRNILRVVWRTVNPAPQYPAAERRQERQRRFATVRADLQDFKKIRRAHGGSVNDVILTVITGALRSWWLFRAEAVTAHTVVRAMVPVSIRPGTGEDGSAVASYLIDLPVAEPNPAMRLHQVSFAMGWAPGTAGRSPPTRWSSWVGSPRRRCTPSAPGWPVSSPAGCTTC